MTQSTLVLGDQVSVTSRRKFSATASAFGQFMTPAWLAEAIVDRYFHDLPAKSLVVEPSCGIGRFLDAIASIRPDLETVGVEIDPVLQAVAAGRGHHVIEGDFTEVVLPEPLAIIGNPPYRSATIDAFLKRAHSLLPSEGRAGFILPVYYFQSATRTTELSRDWSIMSEQIPRSVFPGLSEPLCFSVFTKDIRRAMVGFAFYDTAASIQRWAKKYRDLATTGKPGGSIWRHVVEAALTDLGGEANLTVLYAAIEGRRPTTNPHWREKIRQVVQLNCTRTGRGRYALQKVAA